MLFKSAEVFCLGIFTFVLRLGGGALTITSARHAAPLRVAPNASAHYTTGRLQTQSRRSWGPYGQFEARARVPRARGTNNAVWLMPQSFGSGASTYTEFDIAEILGRDSATAHGTYHWGASAGPLHHRSGGEYIDKAGLSEGFHMCVLAPIESVQPRSPRRPLP